MGALEPDTDSLLDVAVAIADGLGVDWNRLHRHASDPTQRHIVEQLRRIAIVAAIYRGRDEQAALLSSRDPDPAPPVVVGGEESEPRPSGLGQWGDLILIEQIGHGSFGTVYRAHDPQLDRPVAVKLLKRTSSTDEQLASRLLNEGRTLAQVRHPNVVTVYGAGDHNGVVGLSMEFIRGITLEQMVSSHGPFSAGEAALVGHELCGALAAVHRAGLIHRDVKAQNVMREQGGRLVLMDFGAGQKRLQGAPRGAQAIRVVGTPMYLAPEVLSGAGATVRSDIYSLGTLLYYLVTSDFPVTAPTLDELVKVHARGAVTPLRDRRPDLHRGFVRIVERAIHRDPAKRFASAGQMEAALAQLSRFRGTAVPRLRSSERTTQPAPRLADRRGPKVPSVAVLPFTDLSSAKDQEWFCDGMTEELINALTQIPGVRVAARASAFQFKRRARDVKQIGEALGVGAILDGSVRKHGDRLRVTVELVGADNGYQLWSHRFDRRLDDVFAVQDEIAASVANALKGKLKTLPGGLATSRGYDLEAYGSYLEGRYHWNNRTEDELKKSVACFERAVARDPHFAEAYGGLADAYVTLATYGALPTQVVMPRAKRAVEIALNIDATLAEAYACRACVRSVHEWAWADAEEDFRRAIELLPSYPTAHHWYAINLLVPTGRFDEATKELLAALELDPLALAIKTSLGMKSYFAGQFDTAVRELSQTIDLDDRFGMAHLFLGAAYTEQSRFAEAQAELEAALKHSGQSPEIMAQLGYLHGVSGRTDAAHTVLEELEQLALRRYVSPARLAQVHVGLGEHGQALDRLEEACGERAADMAWIGVRPVFTALRSEPRFARILKQMALPTG